jgi:uncharacterized protein DUF953
LLLLNLERLVPNIEYIPELPTTMIKENFEIYKTAKKRINELLKENLNNNQIVLLFVGSRDKRGKIWHNDCNTLDRAVTFLLKKLQVGGHLLRIFVGDRNEWYLKV